MSKEVITAIVPSKRFKNGPVFYVIVINKIMNNQDDGASSNNAAFK